MATKLSEHFTLEELTKSATAAANHIDNTPTAEHSANLQELVTNLLEPLRVAYGKPIRITSGYRGFRLNEKVKGAKKSAHCVGYAADMVPVDGYIAGFKKFVRQWLKQTGKRYDQYIDEHSGASQWVHLAIKSQGGAQRKQNLLEKGGVYTMLPPI